MQKKKSDEDAALIRAYQQGDDWALNQLIGKYRDYIFRIFRYKEVPVQAAEDCTQDICIKLIEGLKRFRFECDFKAFLDTAINRKVIDFYRQQARERLIMSLNKPVTDEEEASTLFDKLENLNHAEGPEEQMDYQDLLRVIGSCLKKFGNQKMRILLCLWLKGLKIREMAELLGIGERDANVTLLRGKEKLRNCVAKYYRKK
jgi:RNA polymerase sigma-70 factor (ECF subfamily)